MRWIPYVLFFLMGCTSGSPGKKMDLKVRLGEKLFFEKRLSIDSSISCSSCHRPDFAFADNLVRSEGSRGNRARRNTPTLMGIRQHPYFLRDGGNPSLSHQVLVPFDDSLEFDLDMQIAVKRLRHDPDIQDLSLRVFGDSLTPPLLIKAIVAFESSSRFELPAYDTINLLKDKWVKLGFSLFQSDRLGCIHCHQGTLLTNFTFQNNGLYKEYYDKGRAGVSGQKTDNGKFKVPVLRFLNQTAPYMHDGSLATLDQVIAHYASGGHDHPNKSPLIRRFKLSGEEKKALKEFLMSI